MPLEKVKLNRNTQKRKLAKLKLRYNKYVNVYIGKKLTPDIERIFFEKEPRVDDGSITLHYSGDPYLSAVLRDIGIFKSLSQAKGAGWERKAEPGFYHQIVTIGKRPHNICIFKEGIKKQSPNLKI